jgi:cytochrome c55X
MVGCQYSLVSRWVIISLLSGVSYATCADTISEARQQALMNLLQQDCGSCHGLTRQGGLGPSLLPDALAGYDDDFLLQTILDGRSGTAMPPWKLFITEPEGRWLIQQLRQGPDSSITH